MQLSAVSEAEQRTVARVAGAVAHELNNPLQGILSLLTVTLRDCRVDERCQLRLEQVLRGVTRMSRTVESLATVYENLPRPPDLIPSDGLIDHFAAEFSEREFVTSILPHDGISVPVICFAREIAKLGSDLFAERMNGHIVVQLGALPAPYGMEVRCELSRQPGVPEEWLPIEQIRGVSGLAVLLDEVTRLGQGTVEFCMRDTRLEGMKFFLRTA